MNRAQLTERYKRLAHAVQSGVAQKMEVDPKECEVKHLRVGINMAMIDASAVGRLLIEKGIVTEEEYLSKLVEFLEQEVRMYEQELSDRAGIDIHLI